MFHFKSCLDNNPLRLAMKYSVDLTIFTIYIVFNVKRTIWLKDSNPILILREVNFSQYLFLAAVALTALCGCRSGNP